MENTYPLSVRFSSKEQKNETKRLAKKDGRSINSYLLSLIDEKRELNKQFLLTKEKK